MDCNGASGEGRCMWKPNRSHHLQLDKFRFNINRKHALKLESYDEMYQWSVENYPEFWEDVWHFVDVKHSKDYDQVVDRSLGISDIPEWFKGCLMNFAENLMHYNDDRVAIYAAMEGQSTVKKITFSELHTEVAKYAAAMKAMGVTKGDRVVGYIANIPQAIMAMLATASIGAIWSSTSPDFGVSGVLDRFTQIQPKLIFSVNAVIYNGKSHNHLEKLQQVIQGLPELEKVVVIPNLLNENLLDLTNIPKSCFLDDFLTNGLDSTGNIPELTFEQVPFNHPMFIMFSSGTTGAPKCMVHCVGGTLIQLKKEHLLHGNMNREDIMLYYTTTGWMMWNWLVSVLSLGAAVALYDGSPLVPTPNVLWDLIDQIGVTILGTGAKWISVLEDKGVKPADSHHLSSLHTILSTGSPLKPRSYDYVYKHVKADVLLGSITGGTDIISLFAGHNASLAVHRGEIQSRCLGMAMECWNDEGKAVYGENGELVCTKPFPSMPTHFWNDPGGIKYKKAYFSSFKGVWSHGDYCMISPVTGGVWMLGRSDGTLNPNGVRFGSADIYNVVESFKEIEDSVCVAQRSRDLSEERVVLFIKMSRGTEFSEDLVKRLKIDIRQQLSARHVPSIILQTLDIPYTQSGKKVEVAIRKMVCGELVTNRGALANPHSLDLYINIPQLSRY